MNKIYFGSLFQVVGGVLYSLLINSPWCVIGSSIFLIGSILMFFGLDDIEERIKELEKEIKCKKSQKTADL